MSQTTFGCLQLRVFRFWMSWGPPLHVKLTLATVDVVGNDYVDTITTTSLIKNDMTYIYAIIDLTYKFEPILDDFVTFMQI
jgi:hypothetical protein